MPVDYTESAMRHIDGFNKSFNAFYDNEVKEVLLSERWILRGFPSDHEFPVEGNLGNYKIIEF